MNSPQQLLNLSGPILGLREVDGSLTPKVTLLSVQKHVDPDFVIKNMTRGDHHPAYRIVLNVFRCQSGPLAHPD